MSKNKKSKKTRGKKTTPSKKRNRTKLVKRKQRQKGTNKTCWCGRPALASGYCPEHL